MTSATHTIPLPIALTIAGSDSGGGAGIQADLKTFQAFGVFGTSVITATTAQNTRGITSTHAIPVGHVRAQIEAVATDLRPAALKTGMLASTEIVSTTADAIRSHELGAYVMDPVMVATSGDRLLAEGAERLLIEELLPLAAVVTPNLEEAALLTGLVVDSVDGMAEAAKRLVALGAGAALITGGHLEGDPLDLLWDGHDQRLWRKSRIETRHTHGTGCTLSAAITAGLANGQTLVDAVDLAGRFVERAIAAAPRLGRGRGPVNHFVSPD